jgi:AcrR family transcriptional regulator
MAMGRFRGARGNRDADRTRERLLQAAIAVFARERAIDPGAAFVSS